MWSMNGELVAAGNEKINICTRLLLGQCMIHATQSIYCCLCCGRMSCPGILCFCLFWIEVHPLSDTHHTINRYYSPPSEATTKCILINCIYTGKYNRLAHLPGHHELDWKESTITMVWGNVIKYGCRGYWKGEYIYLGRRTLEVVLLLVLVVWRRSNVVWLWALYSW